MALAQIRLKMRHTVHYFRMRHSRHDAGRRVHAMDHPGPRYHRLAAQRSAFYGTVRTLRKVFYIVTPDGEFSTLIPRWSGSRFESKSELMAQKVAGIFPDRALRKLFARSGSTAVLSGRESFASQGWRVHHLFEYRRGGFANPMGNVIRYQGALMDVTRTTRIERRPAQAAGICPVWLTAFPT